MVQLGRVGGMEGGSEWVVQLGRVGGMEGGSVETIKVAMNSFLCNSIESCFNAS